MNNILKKLLSILILISFLIVYLPVMAVAQLIEFGEFEYEYEYAATDTNVYEDSNGLEYKDVIVFNHGHWKTGSPFGLALMNDAILSDDDIYDFFNDGLPAHPVVGTSNGIGPTDKHHGELVYEYYGIDEQAQSEEIAEYLREGIYASKHPDQSMDVTNLKDFLINGTDQLYEALMIGYSGGGVRTLAYSIDQRIKRMNYLNGVWQNSWTDCNDWDSSPTTRGIITIASPLQGTKMARNTQQKVTLIKNSLLGTIMDAWNSLSYALEYIGQDIKDIVPQTASDTIEELETVLDNGIGEIVNGFDPNGIGTHDLNPDSLFYELYLREIQNQTYFLYSYEVDGEIVYVQYIPDDVTLGPSDISTIFDQDFFDELEAISVVKEKIDNYFNFLEKFFNDMNRYDNVFGIDTDEDFWRVRPFKNMNCDNDGNDDTLDMLEQGMQDLYDLWEEVNGWFGDGTVIQSILDSGSIPANMIVDIHKLQGIHEKYDEIADFLHIEEYENSTFYQTDPTGFTGRVADIQLAVKKSFEELDDLEESFLKEFIKTRYEYEGWDNVKEAGQWVYKNWHGACDPYSDDYDPDECKIVAIAPQSEGGSKGGGTPAYQNPLPAEDTSSYLQSDFMSLIVDGSIPFNGLPFDFFPGIICDFHEPLPYLEPILFIDNPDGTINDVIINNPETGGEVNLSELQLRGVIDGGYSDGTSHNISVNHQLNFENAVDNFVNNDGNTIKALKQLLMETIPIAETPIDTEDGFAAVRAPILADVYYASLSGGNSDLLEMAGDSVVPRDEIIGYAQLMIDGAAIGEFLMILSSVITLFCPCFIIAADNFGEAYLKAVAFKEFMINFPTWYNEQVMNTDCSDGLINADSTVYPVEYLGGMPITQEQANNSEHTYLNKPAHFHFPDNVHGRNDTLGMDTNPSVHEKMKELVTKYKAKIDHDRRFMQHKSHVAPLY